MFGVGVKNAILFMLIILILHFLIRNLMLEKHLSLSVKSEKKEQMQAIEREEDDFPFETKRVEDKSKELYEYVMREEEHFTEPQPNESFETQLPVACDANLIMKTNISKELPKEEKKLTSQKNPFLVIHEYEDESALNGGKVFDGLDGFDEYGDVYEEYKC